MVQAVPLETSLWIAYPFTGWAKEPSCFSVLRSKNFVLMRLLFLELVLKPERLAYPQPVVQPPEVSYQNEKPEGLTHHRLRSKYRFNWELCRPFRPLRFKDMLTGAFDPGKGFASPSGLNPNQSAIVQYLQMEQKRHKINL
jgi:hypothetical protein